MKCPGQRQCHNPLKGGGEASSGPVDTHAHTHSENKPQTHDPHSSKHSMWDKQAYLRKMWKSVISVEQKEFRNFLWLNWVKGEEGT